MVLLSQDLPSPLKKYVKLVERNASLKKKTNCIRDFKLHGAITVSVCHKIFKRFTEVSLIQNKS